MKKNILTSLVALAALVGFTSCDQDNIGPKFDADLNNACLFAEESMTAFVEPEQNSIPVKVSRLVAESAVDVPIVKINVPDGVKVPESVHFDADETESAFIIVVEDLSNFRADKNYPIELRFDNDHAIPSQTGELYINLRVAPDYADFGTAEYTAWLFGSSWDVDLLKDKNCNVFKLLEPVAEGYDYELLFNEDFTEIDFADSTTGYVHPTYGMIYMIMTSPYDVEFVPADNIDNGGIIYYGTEYVVSVGSFGTGVDALNIDKNPFAK
ncbi:MAG: hypothetical protein J6Y87_07525 [Muribaculaceae bacterium]|nr:hypothetical protein [Muribaculaceae bacterium]MBP5315696.1 hypothetical protein [Muribaculaceae bacterium]